MLNNKPDFPRVVVITLNYDQITYTLDSVDSLLNSDYQNMMVLLIDNGSTQENYLELKNELNGKDKLLIKRLEHNLGYVGGINYGMEEAAKLGADYLLIMNNDTIIDVAAISSLVECAERHDRKAIVSGKVYNYDEKDTLQYIGQEFDKKGMLDQRSIIKNRREKDVGQYDEEREVGMLDDIFWLLPISVFKELGPYSDYFYLYGEQNDYGFRALAKGFRFIYTPKAKLWHKGGVTTCDGEKKSAKIEYWTTFAVFKLAVLHFPENKHKPFIRRWFARQVVKNFIYFCTGRTKFNNLKSTFIAYRHFKHWNEIRYKDNGYNPFA